MMREIKSQTLSLLGHGVYIKKVNHKPDMWYDITAHTLFHLTAWALLRAVFERIDESWLFNHYPVIMTTE